MGGISKQALEKQITASKNFLQERYGIIKLGIFGSYARNEQKASSDVDVFIESEKALGLEFLSIKYYLEDKLGIKVDLATEAMIKPQIREQIFKEIIYLWGDNEEQL
ncbi:nucleotidyltransferase family protein [Bacillus marasmi]|uniref:nucleotidyltransferase family protein n=1 Tax=Bacillus marasmi TaxID=1926279 RepID=UPI001FE5E931|nr:nucleotidyltransferase family protein [Bacillus marasmi]